MGNYLEKEIKKNLLEKVIEENKINFFIRKFFKINEVGILGIYEGLLNNIFQLNKSNENIIKEILTVLKQDDGFFLDNLFSVFRPADETLQLHLFKKLNLKENAIGNNGIITLSEPVFSDKEIVKFFANISKLIISYDKFIELFFLKEVKIPKHISQKALLQAENDILDIFIKEGVEISEERRKNLIEKNILKIEKRHFYLLKNQYKTELNTKLKDLFNISLQKEIEEEMSLINLYLENKINKTFVSFVLENNKKNKQSVIEKANNILIIEKNSGRIVKIKNYINLNQRDIKNIEKKEKIINSINKKEGVFKSMITSTIDKKIKKLLTGGLFGSSKFSNGVEKDLIKQIEKIFLNHINYEKLNEIQTITKTFISKIVFGKLTTINYLKFVKQDEKIKKKIDGKILINKFVKGFLKEHLGNLEKIVKNFNYKILIDYHLYKTERIEKAIIDNFYMSLSDLLIGFNIENYILENFPIELDDLLSKKLENELKIKGIFGFEAEREKEKQKTLIYKSMIFIIVDSLFNVINDNILKTNFNESEIIFFINKEKNKFRKSKYEKIIQSNLKKNYYENFYNKFLIQKDYVSKFSSSFLTGYNDFEMFYKNYIYLIGNKEHFKKIIKEFDGIRHQDFLFNPKHEFSELSMLIEKKEKLGKFLKDKAENYGHEIDFLDEKFVKKFNDIFLELNDVSKIDIIYFINFILTTHGISVKIEESFIRVNIGTKVFIFFSNPSFDVLNNISIFFENNDADKEKIFILMKNNFYYFLNQAFMSNLNLIGVQQEFKNALEYTYHNTDVSDLSIFGSKTLNAGYMIIREGKLYNLVKFKSGSESSHLLMFKTIEKIIENIINLGGAIAETKVVDTTITVGGVEYRTSILRDGDRIGITFRKNGHKSKLKLTNYELRKKYNLEFENIQLVDAREAIPLEAGYEAKDIAIMKRYALQDEGIFWIVGKTGSGKSVSIRNILNYVFDERLKEDIYSKIITLEDPIESKNLNFTQYNAKGKELLEFIKGIKRSDPDILLIGETRNYEMLLDVLEFSSMMGIFTTLHASSLISTLFLLGQYAIRAQVGLTDVLNQTKVIISQKLLKHKKPKVSIADGIKKGHLKYFDLEGKKSILSGVFEGYFSSYISEAELNVGENSSLQKNKILADLKEIRKELIREKKYEKNKMNNSNKELKMESDFTEQEQNGPIEDIEKMIEEIDKTDDVNNSTGFIEISNIENGNTILKKEESIRRYKLWKTFKQMIIKTEILETLHKNSQQPKLYYEYATKELFKDNLTTLMKLSDKDSPLSQIENLFARKTILKEERAFIDLLKGILPFSEFLTLSSYLTPIIFDKLLSNKQINA